MQNEQEDRLKKIHSRISLLIDKNQQQNAAYNELEAKFVQISEKFEETMKQNATHEAALKIVNMAETLNQDVNESKTDSSALKNRINDFIKEIDRCIAQLSV